ncbi:plasmid replication initiator TrfA [Pseudomonas sp.]|uniref:plasmid replication initiator TrfA n=1 Tax=Pseudomonas sp. TaxID=306 RepID=UPI002896A32D|nr:plasmid replication initiator TrfA [Pseudomonas sp.]
MSDEKEPAAPEKTERKGRPPRETALTRIQQRAEKVIEEKVNQLPLWADDLRSAPNEMLRSALFTVGNRNQAREFINGRELHCYGNARIYYTGQELRQEDDMDVWLQVVHMARTEKLGNRVSFRPSEMKKELRWPRGKDYTQKLLNVLERLKATSVRIESTRLGKGVGVSLLRRFEYTTEEGDLSDTWHVEIEPEMAILFAADVYTTRLDWQSRLELRPLAKWLHGFYGTHREPYGIKVETIRESCGSKAKTEAKFKQMLRDALDELKNIDFLKEWDIGKDNIVRVVRNNRSLLKSE